MTISLLKTSLIAVGILLSFITTSALADILVIDTKQQNSRALTDEDKQKIKNVVNAQGINGNNKNKVVVKVVRNINGEAKLLEISTFKNSKIQKKQLPINSNHEAIAPLKDATNQRTKTSQSETTTPQCPKDGQDIEALSIMPIWYNNYPVDDSGKNFAYGYANNAKDVITTAKRLSYKVKGLIVTSPNPNTAPTTIYTKSEILNYMSCPKLRFIYLLTYAVRINNDGPDGIQLSLWEDAIFDEDIKKLPKNNNNLTIVWGGNGYLNPVMAEIINTLQPMNYISLKKYDSKNDIFHSDAYSKVGDTSACIMKKVMEKASKPGYNVVTLAKACVKNEAYKGSTWGINYIGPGTNTRHSCTITKVNDTTITEDCP